MYQSVPVELCNTLHLELLAVDFGYQPGGAEDDSEAWSDLATSHCAMDLTDVGSRANTSTLFVEVEAMPDSADATERYDELVGSSRSLPHPQWQGADRDRSPQGWWDSAHAGFRTRLHPNRKDVQVHSHEHEIVHENLVVRIWLLEKLKEPRTGPEQAEQLIRAVVESLHTELTAE